MKKIILITNPTEIEGEVEIIIEALHWGLLNRVHIRHPMWSEAETAHLLDKLPPALLHRVSLHHHHQLAGRYPAIGIHFNRNNPFREVIGHTTSISCHTFGEVATYRDQVSYLFLSPIFNSISKPNYHATWSLDQLKEAGSLINDKVIALGGINLERLPLLSSLPFGGIALMGDFWQQTNPHIYLRKLRDMLK